MPQKKQSNPFASFTNHYSLSKTLRFELKPVGKTQEMLKQNKVFEKDETIDDSYNQAKFYFDTLHQQFIDEAMTQENVQNLSFGSLEAFLKKQIKELSITKKQLGEARKNKENSKVELLQKEINSIEEKIEGEKKKLYIEIRLLFDAEAENWKEKYKGKTLENGEKIAFSKADMKQKGVSFLTAAGILQILKYKFPESKESEFKNKNYPSLYVEEKENPGKKRYIFDSFEKFSGYLSKFQQTRDNLYADNGIATAVATRIVSNFDIFLANKKTFEEKYKINHHEIGFDQTHIFETNHYCNCLLQNSIEALNEDENNERSYNKIIGLINKKIKEYRDKKTGAENVKKSDYPLLKTLDKQILGKVEKEKQLIEKTELKTEEEVFIEKFKEFIKNNEDRFPKAKEFIKKFFNNNFSAAYEGVYLKKTTINTISRRWFTDSYAFEQNLPQVSKDKKEDDEPKIKKFVSLTDVKTAVEELEAQPFKQFYYDKNIVRPEQDNWQQFLTIWRNEFESLFKGALKEDGEILPGYDSYLPEVKKLQAFSRKKEIISTIKNYADASLRIFQMMKYLTLDERDKSKVSGLLNTDFYAELDAYAKDFEFIKYYNAFRNFITKKPFDEEKMKLNFEKNPPILKGFSKQYSSYLLKKVIDGKDQFYLGIIKSGEIDESVEIIDQSEYWYFPATQLKFQNLVNQAFEPRFGYKYSEQTDELKAIKDAQQFIRERYLSRYSDLKSLVDGKFSSKPEFTKKVNNICIEIYSKNSFLPLDRSQVEDKNENGELYLFEIKNRDWAKYKKENSEKNIHTYYFEQLFDKRNVENPVLKISGGSEIFLRDKTEKIKKDQNHIFTKVKKNDITQFLKDKFNVEKYVYNRYGERKYFLHLSIVLNYGKPQPPHSGDKLIRFVGAYNKYARKKIAELTMQKKEKLNVIGIDRGEKHLLYFSVVNQQGEILDQGSLNEINGVNYHTKLVAREKERLENRQSWQQIAKIKDLKKGYISQVINKICSLIMEHKAIVVLEDLNMRFKQIRGGIERSIYQQFEKALIDKLGYLVFKNQKDLRAHGGVLNGYQLTAPFVSFEKMGKQTGILFYTQADYTSVTDPLTGFRKNLYISNSAPQEKIKEALQKFKAIGWSEEEKSYFFTYNPFDFVDEKYKDNTFSKKWTVYSKVSRISREKNKDGYWECHPINLNQKFEDLLKLWKFNNPKGYIREQIQAKESSNQLQDKKEFESKERNFYHSFIYLFNLILQLRNSYSKQFKTKDEDGKIVAEEIGEDIDFIASPVMPFFSTKAINKKGENLSLAKFADFEDKIIHEDKKNILDNFNGDANGAYNIARKGVMILRKIKKNPSNPNPYISKYEWDDAVSNWDAYVAKGA